MRAYEFVNQSSKLEETRFIKGALAGAAMATLPMVAAAAPQTGSATVQTQQQEPITYRQIAQIVANLQVNPLDNNPVTRARIKEEIAKIIRSKEVEQWGEPDDSRAERQMITRVNRAAEDALNRYMDVVRDRSNQSSSKSINEPGSEVRKGPRLP